MKNQIAVVVALAFVILTPSPLLAHHGTSVSYDASKPMILEGIVTQFVWRNPHAAILLDVTDENGNVVRWGVEMNSPGVLSRAGWTRDTLQAGDNVSMTVSPSRAGTPVGVIDRSRPMYRNGEQVLGTGEFD